MRIYKEVRYNDDILRGYLDKSGSDICIIITHGIGGNKLGHKFIFKQFADMCVDNDISVYRFDFLGTGESGGDFKNTRHSDQVNQVSEFINLAKKEGYKKIYLASTTIGCYSVWHSGYQNKDIRGFINWNPIMNYDRYEQGHLKHAKDNLEMDLKGLYLNDSYILDLKTLKRQVPKQNVPVLILQGDLDHEYDFDDYIKVSKDNNFLVSIIHGGDHLFNSNSAREDLFKKSINFILDNESQV